MSKSVPVLGVDVREDIRRLLETCRTKKKARRKIHGIVLKADRKSTWYSLLKDFNFQFHEKVKAGRSLPCEKATAYSGPERRRKLRRSHSPTQVPRFHQH